MKNITHRLAALATVGAFAVGGTDAAAQTVNFSNVSGNIVKSVKDTPNLISALVYMGGLGLGVTGLFKLKNHVDNPAQAPMKDGLIRLGAGGGLLATPYVANVIKSTVDAGNQGNLSVTPPSLHNACPPGASC